MLKISLFSFVLLFGACLSENTPTQNVSTQIQNVPLSLCRSTASAIDLKNLPFPTIKEGMGKSHLSISTKNATAQRWFDYGINLLHGFWHIEAYRAFNEVIKADSSCAMGYWGIAMCQPGFGGANNGLWIDAINKANLLKENTSALEKGLIEASDILIKQGIGVAQDKFRNLYKTFPNEPEALSFSAIILRQHQNANTQEEVKTLLEDALKRFPDDIGLLHYYIHVMELRQDFAKAQPFADKMVAIAPNSPHIMHMPGHLSFLLGDYQKTVEIFSKARKIEEDYHTSEKIPFSANQNYMHNLHYLAVAESELGHKEKALEAAQKYADLMPLDNSNTKGASMMLLYEGRILPALVNIRFRDWQAAEKKLDFWLNSNAIPVTNPIVKTYLQAMNLYCKGMAAIDKGDIPQAIEHGGAMNQQMRLFEQLGVQKQNTLEFKVINETHDIINMARYELAGWIDNSDKSTPFNSSAWNEALNLEKAIQYDEPPRLMYPIGESLGRLYLKRSETKEAQSAFKQALTKRPNSPMIKKLMART
jgi:tetratricopeptide (TPR) repeat protein